MEQISPADAVQLLEVEGRRVLADILIERGYSEESDTVEAVLNAEEDFEYDRSELVASAFRASSKGDDSVLDALYLREIDALDLYLQPLDSQGNNTDTYVDWEGETVVQIPNKHSYEGQRTQRDARLDHYRTFKEYDVPVLADWSGVDLEIDGERSALLVGDYNPNLESLHDLSGEEREIAEKQAGQIADTVVELIDEEKVSYAEGKRMWEQSIYGGHMAWDGEREEVVVTDPGESV